VIASDASKKRLLFTLKKSIVNSTLPIVCEYSQELVGSIVHGYIVAVKPFGCIVGFFGDVKALIPISELSYVIVLVSFVVLFCLSDVHVCF
jgi:rRNA biogenesis protein RRP5